MGNKEPNRVTSLSILASLGSSIRFSFVKASVGERKISDFYSSLIWGLLSDPFSFLWGLLKRGGSEFRWQVSAFGFAYLPLTFAGHLAFLIPI